MSAAGKVGACVAGAAGVGTILLVAYLAGGGPGWTALCAVGSAAITAFAVYSLGRRAERRRRLLLARTAAGILHDLRGPLTVISANVEFLADASLTTSERAQCFHEAKASVEQIPQMLQDFFDYVGGAATWNPQPIDLCAVLEDEARQVVRLTGGAEVQLACHVTPPVAGLVDERWLRRALRNVVANGIQASARHIAIRAACDGREARVQVSDDGKGMPPKVCERAFEPFFTYGKRHGTGLGMSVVRDVANRAGGRAWCESDERRGTRVSWTVSCAGRDTCGAAGGAR